MNQSIVQELEKGLVATGRKLILANIDPDTKLPDEWRDSFAANLDAVEEHQPRWHHWGIVTHSFKFRAMYNDEARRYLEAWGLYNAVAQALSEEIDGVAKADLFQIMMPWHDLGKFWKKPGKRPQGDFGGHHELSAKIILTRLKGRLTEYGLTEDQIQYIARCAMYHYELAFLRKKAIDSEAGYDIKFTESDAFKKAVMSRPSELQDIEVEIGLMFLADSLAKTDIILQATTDAGIIDCTSYAKDELAKRSLNKKLIGAVLQRPVSIAVARRYLELIASLD